MADTPITPDPAARTNVVPPPSPIPPTPSEKAWKSVSENMDYLLFATGLGIVGALGVGIWFIIAGASEGEIGGFFDSQTFVYQLRPTGVLLVALALLVGPLALAVELGISALAKDRLNQLR